MDGVLGVADRNIGGTRRTTVEADGRSTVDIEAGITTSCFNNASGLVLRRERTQRSPQNPTAPIGSHFFYYADGKRIGDVSDDPSDNPRVSYAEQLATKRQDAPDRKTLYRTFKPVTSADIDQNYEPINESYPAVSCPRVRDTSRVARRLAFSRVHAFQAGCRSTRHEPSDCFALLIGASSAGSAHGTRRSARHLADSARLN